ncbi:Mycophenolic acid synthesis protein B [Lasiodiplodia hormozganensis]|uniref:Mycophenolic acid synthesis protein B n=1 Tax=Lasiodiplodia hormozganensis TaxID=869390 RepID=A0AA39YWT4_9PEZI|nr:Mycophenolic acid synthesis protein B [Lasiodiplodia hormozganensis]
MGAEDVLKVLLGKADNVPGFIETHPKLTFGASVLLCYTLLCKALRFQRLRRMQSKYPYMTRGDMARMTNEEAQEIQKELIQCEFPFTMNKALQFALFRTYGIPTISRLLVQTQQLSEKEHAPRRYVDTEVLIQDFIANSPESERANAAIARMNYLHSLYRKSGKISNGDLLYTLALFALEPKNWINRYEWRKLTDLEICALGTFWKSVGDAMEISYEELPGSTEGWKDGIQWIDEVAKWSEAYEKKYMVPHQDNKKTADETTAMLLYDAPSSLHPVGFKVVSALMDGRLRKAMMYSDPPAGLVSAIDVAFKIRAFLLRNLALPRPHFLRSQRMSDEPNKDGRYYQLSYDVDPWYVEATFANRWAAKSWLKWMAGKPYPGSAGFKSEGYVLAEIGPKNLEGKGTEYVTEAKERLLKQGRGGCPFAVAKS